VNVVCVGFRSNQKGHLQGFVDLVIEPLGIRLYSCELFRSATAEWLTFPSRPYESREGKQKFARMVDFTTRAAYEAFASAALVAIRQFRAEHPTPGKNLPANAGTSSGSQS